MKKQIFSITILLILDILWIMIFMIKKYNILIPKIQNSKLYFNFTSSIIAYAVMVFGLVHFVLPNLNENSNLIDYFNHAFLFGVVIYGVYNFTCGAVFKDWDFSISIIDVLWGGFVYTISAYLGIKLSNIL